MLLDVVRCPRLTRQGDRAQSQRKCEGGKGMTLIELSIKMSGITPVKTCIHSTLTGRSAVFFKRRTMKISPRGLPILSPEHQYGCYTMIATNIQYFSSVPSSSFVLDHTMLDKGGGSTEEEQCTSTRQMYQVAGCSSL